MYPVTHIAGIHSPRLWLDSVHAAIVLSLSDAADSLCTELQKLRKQWTPMDMYMCGWKRE